MSWNDEEIPILVDLTGDLESLVVLLGSNEIEADSCVVIIEDEPITVLIEEKL